MVLLLKRKSCQTKGQLGECKMKNKRLTFVVSLLAIYLIGAFFVNQKWRIQRKKQLL